uniref:Immunoglobulin V-set domain-containing protein n=1 Tax=Cyprinus carpio TaxID=7962 RepID=A0A8C2F645_CYPCA
MHSAATFFFVYVCIVGTLSMKTLDYVTVREGGTITIPCLYDNKYKLNSKYWCEGYTWFSCRITARANATWTITDSPANNTFTVKLYNPTSPDSGYYWCLMEKLVLLTEIVTIQTRTVEDTSVI